MNLNCFSCGRDYFIDDSTLKTSSHVSCPSCNHKIPLPHSMRKTESKKQAAFSEKKKKTDNFNHNFKFFSIKWKIALAFCFILLITFSSLLLIINSIFKKEAINGLENRAATIAKSIVTYGTTPILSNRMDILNGLIGETTRFDPDIAYVFIQLPEKQILFHNLPAGIPDDVLASNQPGSNKSQQFRYLKNSQNGIIEVVFPVLNKTGNIRVGISDERSMQIIRSNQKRLLIIMVSAVILGTIASILLARKITRPLVSLSQAFDRISLGDLNCDVIKIKSRDEVKILAESFERMRFSVSKAIERRRTREKTVNL